MTDAPDLDFPLYSRHSRTRHDVHFHHMLAELETELLRRRDRYPQFVLRRQLTAEEAERQIELLLAVIADFNRYRFDEPGRGDEAFGYFDKVNCLRREVLIRRSLYPKLLDAGKLTLDQASQQLGRLEAAHDWYWNGDGLNRIGAYAAFADEMDRRNRWMAGQAWRLGAGELEAIVPVYTRTAMPRPNGAGQATHGLVRRRFRHIGPGPFSVVANPQPAPSHRLVNVAGDDALWCADDYASLDRALHGPRCPPAPVYHGRETLETIAAALNRAADDATAETDAGEADLFQAAE